ncbi:hypothetical protein AAG906_022754 [Vitis piasezkii]
MPLGPIPAVYSLSMALISTIRDTWWFWWRSKTPLQWLLCFLLGTQPSGPAFFWSYTYYLSHFLHMFRTYFTILGHCKLGLLNIFKNLMMLCMLFMWLEFSQSFQLFWVAIGLPSTCFPFVLSFQIVLLGSNVLCHVGAFLLHLRKDGCNGIGAWIFNKTSLKELLDIWQKHI